MTDRQTDGIVLRPGLWIQIRPLEGDPARQTDKQTDRQTDWTVFGPGLRPIDPNKAARR
jgi:hypothetical protein